MTIQGLKTVTLLPSAATKAFTTEILEDLNTLIEEHPRGVTVYHLLRYYGEPYTKIRAAIQLLAAEGIVDRFKNNQNMYYIVPKGYKIPVHVMNLTNLQALIAYRIATHINTTRIDVLQTSYAQLARWISCSNGGLRKSIQELVACGYLEIVSDSCVGKAAELRIKVTDKLKSDYQFLLATVKDFII